MTPDGNFEFHPNIRISQRNSNMFKAPVRQEAPDFSVGELLFANKNNISKDEGTFMAKNKQSKLNPGLDGLIFKQFNERNLIHFSSPRSPAAQEAAKQEREDDGARQPA